MGTNNNHDIERIEQYIDNQLSDNEKEQFVKDLENDNAFAELYQFRLKIRDDLQKAKQYKQIRDKVSFSIKKTKGKTRKRNIIYAAAASLTLLIAIPGIIGITSQPDITKQVVSTNDTLGNELYTPQVKQPESFGNQGEYRSNKLTLTFDEKNDSLIFQWLPALKKQSNLIIMQQSDGEEVFRKEIKINTKQISISNKILPSCKLIWYIEASATRDSFEINNN
jgi:hypothetical protein